MEVSFGFWLTDWFCPKSQSQHILLSNIYLCWPCDLHWSIWRTELKKCLYHVGLLVCLWVIFLTASWSVSSFIVLGGGHVIVRGSILRQEGLGYKRRVDEQVRESKPVINAPLRSLALTLSSLMMDNNLNDEINPFFLSLVLPTL